MEQWEKEIYRGEFAQEIKAEYRSLLSVNLTELEAEKLIIEHFTKYRSADAKESRMWFALALSEWRYGRLTDNAREQVAYWADSLDVDVSSKSISKLLERLNSPMPEKKRIRPHPAYAHCPWPVGTLLAYRIISSNSPLVTQSKFYKKYVLLRIIKLTREPISNLAPEAGWGESMLVGLYNWIGDSIPSADIVKDLQFTEVRIEEVRPISPTVRDVVLQNKSLPQEHLQGILSFMFDKRVETCCSVDWRCVNGIRTEDVFTCIGFDPSFQEKIDPFFKTDITQYALSHSLPFDATLVKRFEQLESEGCSSF